MKKRQEQADEEERQRLQAEANAKAAQEAAEQARIQAEASARDQADAPGSPQSGRENEAGKCTMWLRGCLFFYFSGHLTLLT